MIGLGYKPGSDDLRDSPKIELARKFLDAGFGLSIYDPYVGLTRMTRNDAATAMAVLPGLKEMLVTAAEAEASEYDLVVDTFGWSDRLKLKAPARVDLHALA
jgi:GDP-mannose 6-dehydrogenase